MITSASVVACLTLAGLAGPGGGSVADHTPPTVAFLPSAGNPGSEMDPRAPEWSLALGDDNSGIAAGILHADLWLVEPDSGERRLLDSQVMAIPEGDHVIVPLPAFRFSESLSPGAPLEIAVYRERTNAMGSTRGPVLVDATSGAAFRYTGGPTDAAGNPTGPVVIRSFRAAGEETPLTRAPASNHVLAIQGAAVGPNPFLPAAGNANIVFSLTRGAEVTITAYDWAGRFVDDVFEGFLVAGPQTVEWGGQTEDGRKLGNGVYLLRIAAATQPRSEFEVLKVAVWNEN